MTAQWHDEFEFQGKKYSLVGVNGQGLFNPAQYDMVPMSTCSACWRGFLCKYAVVDNKLVLDSLQISLEESSVKDPKINNKLPSDSKDSIFNFHYKGLNLQLDFTGGILIGDGFIEDLYVHMGYHPAWKYKNVIEFYFNNGEMFSYNDVSKKLKQIRKKMKKEMKKGSPYPDGPDLQSWISSTFKLDYRL